MNLSQQFEVIKQQFNQKVGRLNSIKERHLACNEKIAQLVVTEEQTAKASLFLQSLSDSTRIQVLDRISGIVTECLQVVQRS